MSSVSTSAESIRSILACDDFFRRLGLVNSPRSQSSKVCTVLCGGSLCSSGGSIILCSAIRSSARTRTTCISSSSSSSSSSSRRWRWCRP